MDGSMYIESNHLSFISYNDCNYHQAVISGQVAAANGAIS